MNILIKNYNNLVSNLRSCYNKIDIVYSFSGPALYFHERALHWQQKDFLSDNHIEAIYATLVAWGMHRMGDGGAKMPDYSTFKESILDNKSDLENLRHLSIENIKGDQIDTIAEKLRKICFSIAGTTSNSHLVSGSKTLAHILPNLVCPIDRQYTCKFFGVHINSKNEQAIFKDIICQMWEFYQNLHHIKLLKPILGQPFNESYPKIFDNLIIEYQKKNSSNGITSKKLTKK